MAALQRAADAVDERAGECTLVAQQTHLGGRRFIAPIAFAVRTGAQDEVLHLCSAQALGQEVGEHRFAAVGRAANEDSREGMAHGRLIWLRQPVLPITGSNMEQP
jgi:hypothetical protein